MFVCWCAVAPSRVTSNTKVRALSLFYQKNVISKDEHSFLFLFILRNTVYPKLKTVEQDNVTANPDLEAQTRSPDNGLSPLYVNFEGRC
jgi:hypothetical protein